jgi:hypothetical protein
MRGQRDEDRRKEIGQRLTKEREKRERGRDQN